ncbi:hypothetical protein JOF28_001239 [Leucobacter exalbidus]|uniref:Uncharacterized protein n=1 Tax=Leucobacter exalbidus TaxID=662960 RepID=A0A940PSK6_9MICO|nr:hypothetical protein [Leucobacter exalbidus]MBP1326007.1 hypothetical protein [Leucobacter exalbidus]
MTVSHRMAVAGIIACALLTGCAPLNSFENEVLQSAKRGESNIKLPQHGPVDAWSSVLVVCPYADLSKIDSPFADGLPHAGPSESIPESSQSLIFTNGSETESLQLDRAQVDFCSQDLAEPFAADQSWAVSQSGEDGRYMLAPVS